MSEQTTIEAMRDALDKIHRRACYGKSEPAYMSVPADPQRDADLILSNAICELSALRARVAELEAKLSDVYAAMCEYRCTEGCGCCADSLAHESAEQRLALLLGAVAQNQRGYTSYLWTPKE